MFTADTHWRAFRWLKPHCHTTGPRKETMNFKGEFSIEVQWPVMETRSGKVEISALPHRRGLRRTYSGNYTLEFYVTCRLYETIEFQGKTCAFFKGTCP
ncbi:hypothetical protein BaRGS_00026458 [Batillaria attramentaria]|uniref:Arrestin-like N-terminal domain-containing protein n=1 Tax=Batillaria attramentaria TaxID=370345 RepID=A0ABD0K4I3_9CAEN